MIQEKPKRGGARPGAGRPKKKSSEYQKTHSLRATDKDWKTIQVAVRTIKACKTIADPHVLILSKEDFVKYNKFLLDNVIEQRHDSLKQPEPLKTLPASAPTAIVTRKPESLEEEDAVSVFLEYYRLNPIEASSLIQSKLDRELRIKKSREARRQQSMIENNLEKKAEDTFQTIDDINARVAQMLQFGYGKN